MINNEKWINSLPRKNINLNANTLDNEVWENTVPKKKMFSSIKIYSTLSIVFISGLLFVSVVKNDSRNLQKEINSIEASINILKFNLNQETLDNEIFTSPGYISQLAKDHLNIGLVAYNQSQIKYIDKDDDIFSLKEKNKITSSKKIKLKVIEKINIKKTEIKKLQEFYNEPAKIPGEIKLKLAKTITQKKNELKKLYTSPKEMITFNRVQRWTAIQVAKIFLGVPVVPGK